MAPHRDVGVGAAWKRVQEGVSPRYLAALYSPDDLRTFARTALSAVALS
jgi:hypothetical protein